MKITREEISDTAVKLFLDKGYNNVTIQDICNELNITKPTLYKYISNKEDLILDLYDSTIDHLVKDTYKLVDSDSHYQQLLIVFSTLIKDTKKYGYDLFSQMFIANLKENRNSFAMRENLTKLCIIIIKKAPYTCITTVYVAFHLLLYVLSGRMCCVCFIVCVHLRIYTNF